MRAQATRAGELRRAVDSLPLRTRRAMLEGIQTNPIIVGADGDPRGGVCPVYATSNPPSRRIGKPFARAWDRYAGVRLPRRASERELQTLRSMLETSIERELETGPELAISLHAEIVAHKASQARNEAASAQRESRPEVTETRPDTPEKRSDAVETRRPAPRRDTGELDRSEELSRRPGWAWLRPVRTYDEYEQAMQTLEELAREVGFEPEPDEQLVTSSYGRG